MTYLNYDASGFIVGIDKMSKGIDSVHDDTQEIIQILKSQNQIANTRMSELARAVKTASYRNNSQGRIDASRGRERTSRATNGQNSTNNATIDTLSNRAPIRRQGSSSNQAGAGQNSRANTGRTDQPVPISRDSANASSTRQRDANGRFTGGNASNANADAGRERDANGRFTGGSSTVSGKSGFSAGMKGMGQTNIGGVDPLLDSLKEAKDLLSPLGRGAKMVGRGAKFSLSKMKALKRREPLPADQDRHNRENEKLLDKIWKAIKKQAGGGGRGGGLLGGLLGGGGRGRGGGIKNLFKKLGGIKALGLLSAVAGTAGLAMDWGNLDHEGKSAGVGKLGGAGAGALAGAAVGSVVPVVGTAIGAVVGGWLGSEAGEWLGRAASPHIQSWTSAITAYNLPQKMSVTWNDGIKPFFSKMDALAGKMSAWIDQQMTDMGNTVSATGAGLAEALGLADLGSVAEKYESGGRGVGTVSTGAGDHGGVSYGTHQLSSKTGTMAAFLKSPDGQKFAGEFAGLSAGSAAFNSKYKDVANRRGDEFKKSQQDYITRTHYMPAKQIAEGYGFDTKNRGIQEAIYSHSTQYGANHKSRFKRVAESGVDMKDNEAVLKAFYADKAAYVNKDFSSSSASVKASVAKRIKAEQADVLAISKVSDVKNAVKETVETVADKAKEVVTQKQPASKQVNKSAASQAKNNNSALGVQVGNMRPNTGSTKEDPASKFTDNAPMIFKNGAGKTTGGDFGYAPANFPDAPMLNIPKMPQIKTRLDSGGKDKPIMMQGGGDTINQNVSDRSLAHAITGGLGQQRQWG